MCHNDNDELGKHKQVEIRREMIAEPESESKGKKQHNRSLRTGLSHRGMEGMELG